MQLYWNMSWKVGREFPVIFFCHPKQEKMQLNPASVGMKMGRWGSFLYLLQGVWLCAFMWLRYAHLKTWGSLFFFFWRYFWAFLLLYDNISKQADMKHGRRKYGMQPDSNWGHWGYVSCAVTLRLPGQCRTWCLWLTPHMVPLMWSVVCMFPSEVDSNLFSFINIQGKVVCDSCCFWHCTGGTLITCMHSKVHASTKDSTHSVRTPVHTVNVWVISQTFSVVSTTSENEFTCTVHLSVQANSAVLCYIIATTMDRPHWCWPSDAASTRMPFVSWRDWRSRRWKASTEDPTPS